jgi:hypothetical protein
MIFQVFGFAVVELKKFRPKLNQNRRELNISNKGFKIIFEVSVEIG